MKLCLDKEKYFKPNGELKLKLVRKRSLIEEAEAILTEYVAQGYRLMVRQLYYQFVARGLLENNDKNWNKLKDTVKEARCAGLLDWDAIEDRSRQLRAINHEASAAEALRDVAAGYSIDKWLTQKHRVEVWVEKDSLVDVVGRACDKQEVDYLSHRGSSGLSVYYEAAKRFSADERTPIILHLADCDPAGFYMTANVRKRLEQFQAQLKPFGDGVQVRRIGLTLEQVKPWPRKLPPNKIKDSDPDDEKSDKAKKTYTAPYKVEYEKVFGVQSTPVTWELDALTPQELEKLIRDAVKPFRNTKAWKAAQTREDKDRERLLEIYNGEARDVKDGGIHWLNNHNQ